MSLSDSGVQAFLEGEENQITERNTKVTNSVALVMEFIGAENVYLKDFLCSSFAGNHLLQRTLITISMMKIFPFRTCMK